MSPDAEALQREGEPLSSLMVDLITMIVGRSGPAV
jgi:hypothetical protein